MLIDWTAIHAWCDNQKALARQATTLEDVRSQSSSGDPWKPELRIVALRPFSGKSGRLRLERRRPIQFERPWRVVHRTLLGEFGPDSMAHRRLFIQSNNRRRTKPNKYFDLHHRQWFASNNRRPFIIDQHFSFAGMVWQVHSKHYWILDAKNAIRRQIWKCVKCYRFRAERATQLMIYPRLEYHPFARNNRHSQINI